MKTLKDKVAVITGGNDGIGKEIALKLAAQGVKLALVARNEKKLNQTKDEIGSDSTKIYSCDINVPNKRKDIVSKIISDFGQIDILINNAGIIHALRPLEEFDEEEIDSVITTNLISLIQITRLVLPHIKKQTEGAIINISSVAGVRYKKGQSVYAASKWGVRGFSGVLKEDLKDTNVRVSCVCQGGVDTKLFEKAGDNRDTTDFIQPEDLADVIVFMLSRPDHCWVHEVHVEK
ncbi:SDR family oxidoreductase [Patescibacteria group bacterium]|nr:SDR family oxidoreductase [Patescibacteria group bacterium]